MAEEKKETTKKTTPKKKEVVEEVKVEKRFCTNCGKELKEGETCDCSSNATNSAVTVNGDAILNTCKDIWNTIINVFRRPATTIKEEVESKNTNKSIILVILLAITFALYLMSIVSLTESSASDLTYGVSSTLVDVNYFQVFIYGILIYALMTIIPIVSAIIVAKITRNADFSFKKAFKLYIISSAPLVLAYLGMAIIFLLDVTLLDIIGLIAFGIISISCFFNFILGFNSETKIRDDRRSYALTSIIVLWIVLTVVAYILVLGSIAGDFVGKTTSSYGYNISNR